MTSIATYPLDVRGFIVETLRLPLACKAAYLMILVDYCARGEPPPDDDHVLAALTSAAAAWPLMRPVVAPLFDIRDGRWYHTGIEAELERVRKVQANAVRASQIAGLSKRRKKAPEPPPMNTPDIVAAMADAAATGLGVTQTHIPVEELTIPEPPSAATMEPMLEDFVLTGDDVLECQTRGATLDEIAEWLDYFRGYHLKAGTLAEDWTVLWYRFVDRKIEERDKGGKKAKPRVEVSRRAPAPPPG